MGRPNPAKLGNFPEVEVWVHVADPLGLVLDCKEYLGGCSRVTGWLVHLQCQTGTAWDVLRVANIDAW